MNLSKRLKTIASLVKKNANVIDIGCDHGLLDIYLTKENNNKCIAADVNENALESAKNNINKYNVDVKTVLSDGLNNIDVKKNTVIIIAGMGTKTILDILNNDKAKLANTIIVQSNNDYYLLRKTMMKKHYSIVEEIAVLDKNKWYIIMKFNYSKKHYSLFSLILGPVLKNKTDINTINYYKYMLKKNEKILLNIPNKYFVKKLYYKILNNKIKTIIKRK